MRTVTFTKDIEVTVDQPRKEKPFTYSANFMTPLDSLAGSLANTEI